MDSANKKALGVVATLVALQLLLAAPMAMARSPPALEEMAQSAKIAIERLILETPVESRRCGSKETCYTGMCYTPGCYCEYPLCVRPSAVAA
ncbi:hypothetical protein D1007_61727 [Hordeum vulgare]|uniref:Uncharacterized protein n=1 Tax=Hordeum vulgare subsp. vulgare TaxID=112509 RepID=A0A8I6WP83_HORVV|nr:hypothetical protein D1007_61727 [Hordeum vulgare]